MANSIIGQIVSIGPTQTLTSQKGTSFTKRDIVISVRRFDPNTGEPVNDYDNTPLLSFMGEKCAELDKFQIGQNVEIFIDIQGRKYTDSSNVEKIITDVRPYKIQLYGRAPQVAPSVPAPSASAPQQQYQQQYQQTPAQAPAPTQGQGYKAPY